MKRFIYLALALFGMITLCASCNNKVQTGSLLEGEWHYSSEQCDIYVSFASTGSFELFQKLGEGRHYLYCGTWSLEGDTLGGVYNDGTPWGSSYTVSFDGDNTMTLTATNGSSESNTYTRTTIPEEVRSESAIQVRSVELDIPTPLL